MPTVLHSFRGDNRQPRLKLPKVEREILLNAEGLCKAIADATAGHHAELSAEALDVHKRLARLAEIEELDLTKPW